MALYGHETHMRLEWHLDTYIREKSIAGYPRYVFYMIFLFLLLHS